MSQAAAPERTAKIEDEIWELENSYGFGPWHDHLVTERIAKLRAQITSFGASERTK